MKYTVSVIICAAGKGARAGFDKNKLLVPFQGSTALEKSLSAFDFPTVNEIVIAASHEDFSEISALCKKYERTSVVLGGETRSASVYNALQTVQSDIVLIHDGARPFVTREVIERCIQSVKSFGSGICAIPCTDTVAVAEKSKIQSVPDRNTLWQIQTPQGFFRENILAAYQQAIETANASYTDDSSVFAAFCGKPVLCDGAKENIKLTHASDFADNTARCGFGVDTHAFGKEQTYITLGGVKIPSETGLIAHSDGDVLIHALMDALLSAAGLKDIGHYFPDTDEQWKNADSMKMLETVVGILAEIGYSVKNVSVSVQAEKPRLAKHIDEMKNRLSSALKVDPTAVGITAGTNEGLGYVGEGKGITVYAYALLRSGK
ncbi:MAG: 2-C-methyl-D-erythritol 4-phosphate cytidylyltransferase [Clostridia bacterium]|nr:2-C-methyl-D-erythritol 4-phosphate cytidylyltransferase [Clostridia bacterium]